MPAPTFVNSYSDGASVTNAPTASVTNAVGDSLLCVVITEDNAVTSTAPTGGTGITWSAITPTNLASECKIYAWTANPAAVTSANTAQSIGTTVNGGSGGGGAGFSICMVMRWSGSDGFGNNGSSTNLGTATRSQTTGTANSALVAVIGDWNAVVGTSRTWATINSITPTSGNGGERYYLRDSGGAATFYIGQWTDVGATGAKTAGITSPTGQKAAVMTIEVLGTTGAAAPYRQAVTVAPMQAAMRAASW